MISDLDIPPSLRQRVRAAPRDRRNSREEETCATVCLVSGDWLALRLERDLSRTPLTQVVLLLLDAEQQTRHSVVGMEASVPVEGGLESVPYWVDAQRTQFDITFSLWEDDGFPATRGWYSWTGGKCNYAGGTYRNSGRDLPLGDSYLEFDVKPRACGAARDALRIVVDLDTGQAWYSPDHYTTFLEIV